MKADINTRTSILDITLERIRAAYTATGALPVQHTVINCLQDRTCACPIGALALQVDPDIAQSDLYIGDALFVANIKDDQAAEGFWNAFDGMVLASVGLDGEDLVLYTRGYMHGCMVRRELLPSQAQ